jgi:hypothetical protein
MTNLDDNLIEIRPWATAMFARHYRLTESHRLIVITLADPEPDSSVSLDIMDMSTGTYLNEEINQQQFLSGIANWINDACFVLNFKQVQEARRRVLKYLDEKVKAESE